MLQKAGHSPVAILCGEFKLIRTLQNILFEPQDLHFAAFFISKIY